MVKTRRFPITRLSHDGGCTYQCDGRTITDPAELDRLAALAIPPAWTDVEISGSGSAKILARGKDSVGRTQAIYGPAFRRRQARRKFNRMLRFGKRLPTIRARIDADLSSRSLNRRRIAACVVHLIDLQLFRVGNTEYAERNGSFGITTLREGHVDITSTMVDFNFVGKSGKEQHQRVRERRTARLLARLTDLPGPEVFRYLDDESGLHSIRSNDINSYIKRNMGREFSAKDFRTWGGTVTVVAALCDADPQELATPAGRARVLREAVKVAAERLGNTVQVTKSSYIDPRVFRLAEDLASLRHVREQRFRARKYFSLDEQRTLTLLT